jgi:2-polyprenyl-3-methyl-5-hydroxy-6-metoxy-1,4-benzoquinol methylase
MIKEIKELIKSKIKIRNRIDIVMEEISEKDEVLSMGCARHSVDQKIGGNFLLRELKEKSKDVVGVDILEEEIEKLKEIGFNAIAGDAQRVDIGRKFDKVVAGEIIEHVENPGLLLENCKNHLKNNGVIIVTTPNPRRKKPGNPEHTMWFDWYVIDQLASRINLKVERVEEYAPGMHPVSLILYNLGLIRNLSSGGWVFIISNNKNMK